ncbi:hypothetical protein [Pasteuria penetrans]|uniref:hypothetical protein n=1 Tax=Pasteuria penetrans TaxID=86005 RepID=UPI000FACBEFE|nr:hypothetical protein [Pasteuria penetrans]
MNDTIGVELNYDFASAHAALSQVIDDELACLHSALRSEDRSRVDACKSRLLQLHGAMEKLHGRKR